ncbi:response regulator [Olivibacter domesticus]|uniref:Response regulator receiver domain-containing protein n=1 Tax=Olivibacter domesticus TaxID=407022 RepID=A0A1H7KGS2_OLID1|nr:response regulator [Olivibacter domesticus]SEK85998.1 Response regulator receiver domain-containing protein [Olivibacter domesticus]
MAKRILILDDDEDILYFCTEIFEALDFDVKSVSHTEDILKTVADSRPDIILIDNWMPGIQGKDATKTLKSADRFKEIPVVLFSAGNNLEQIAKSAGADAFLEKPFDISTLENLILDLLKRKQ